MQEGEFLGRDWGCAQHQEVGVWPLGTWGAEPKTQQDSLQPALGSASLQKTALSSLFWPCPYVHAQLLSSVWLCEPRDCSLPACSVYGIILARTLVWVAISFSRGSSWPRDWARVSGSCFGRWILCPWATWEAQHISIKTLKMVHICQEAFNRRLPVCCFGCVRNPLVLIHSWIFRN